MKRTQAQIDAWKNTMKLKPIIPWNKGLAYVHENKEVYANKGGWNKAMRRIYPDVCMRCGWHEGSCDTHHIIAKSSGGEFTLDNGIILCPNCHRLADAGILSPEYLKEIKNNANSH